MKKPTRDDRGAAMVEFALIVPLLLMLLMGIIEFGRAYNTRSPSRPRPGEGARELALHKSSSDVDPRVRAAAPSVTSISQTPCPATGDGQATVVVSRELHLQHPLRAQPRHQDPQGDGSHAMRSLTATATRTAAPCSSGSP